MKKLLLMAVTAIACGIFVSAPSAYAEDKSGESIINHNKIIGEIEVNKKFKFLFIDRVSVAAGKTVLTNVFGNEFDPVSIKRGWYGKLTFKIDLD